jgi:hypothetical protein
VVTEAAVEALVVGVVQELAAADYDLAVEELPAFPDIYPRFGQETANDPFEELSFPLPAHSAYPNDTPLYIHSSGAHCPARWFAASDRCARLDWHAQGHPVD